MSEMMDVLNAFGSQLKLAWVGWLAWGVGQYFWFRHERSMPAKKVTAIAKAVAKKAAVPKTVAAQAAEAPVVGRLFTPTHVVRETSATAMPQVQPERVEVAAQTPVAARTPIAAQTPTPMPMPVVAAAEEATAPVFDPSKAVIEQFGATDDVLDKFVRDFEMQDARPRRRKTTRVPETPSFGAEAPQVP